MSENKKIKISVIVIGYNIEEYILRCLNSILIQDYQNTEIIFVDDGSVDSTLDIANSCKNHKLRIIKKINGGIISARKEGLSNAIGDYVCFVDGDDYLNSNMLSNLVKPLLNNDYDIVCSDTWFQYNNGKTFVLHSKTDYGILEDDSFFTNIMNDNLIHHMFPRLYKRSFLLNAGYMDFPNISMAEDLLTNSFLGIHKPRVLFLNDVNYYYCHSKTSMTHNNNNGILRQIDTLSLMEEYFLKHKLSEECMLLLIYQWYSYIHVYICSEIFDTTIKKRLIIECGDKILHFKNNKYISEFRKNNFFLYNMLVDSYIRGSSYAYFLDKIVKFYKKIKRIIM